jgi:hypothetical protein
MALDTYAGGQASNIFMASTQAGVATSTALSTTQTGFTLTNPLGSGKCLEVLQIRGALTTAPAAIATVVLAAGALHATAVTQTTPLTVRNANFGVTKTGAGLAASAVTLPAAPVVVRGLGGPVATGSVSQPQIVDNVDGAIVLAPGTSLNINSLTTAISGVWSMTWREVDEYA